MTYMYGHINQNSRHFSDGGKEVLIKSILQSLPNYAMGIFRIPSSICADIERLCNDFWWGKKPNGKRMHWMTWDALCLPKSKGGMGFRKMAIFNKAMLAKQLWRIFTTPESLVARVLKARYFKQVDLMDASLGSNPSFVWRSLLSSKDLLEHGLYTRIGNGQTTNVFKHKWVPGLNEGRPSSRFAPASTVNRFIFPNLEWNETLLRQEFLSFEVEQILRIPIGEMGSTDVRFWKFEANGKYSVSSGYSAWWSTQLTKLDVPESSSSVAQQKWYDRIWHLRIPPKVRTFMWKFLHEIVATEANLARHHVPVNPICFLCNKYEATTSHSLIFCSKIRHVWRHLSLWEFFHPFLGLEGSDLLHSIISIPNRVDLGVLAMYLWAMWRARCEIKHNKDGREAYEGLLRKIRLDWAADYLTSFQHARRAIRIHAPSIISQQHRQAIPEATIRVAANTGRLSSNIITGSILFDGAGSVIRVLASEGHSSGSQLSRALQAILAGVQLGLASKFKTFSILSDEVEAVDLFRHPQTIYGPSRAVWDEIQKLVENLAFGGVKLIPTSNNTAARHLVTSPFGSPLPHDWEGAAIPPRILDLARTDIDM